MNNTSLLLFLAIIPVILILLFVYNKDKTKEPFGLLMQFFGLGILSCFLVFIVSDLLGFLPFMNMDLEDMNFLNIILYSFIGIAFVEETCKWIMVYFKGYNHKEFDEIYDIIVYSVFVSLGFAFFENMLYIFENGDFSVAILRALLAVPGHACDAIFMGYYLSLAKQYQYKKEKELEKKNTILSILIPSVLHGIYDFCLMSGFFLLILVFFFFVISLYIVSIKKIKEIAESNIKIKKQKNFCLSCGSKIDGPFCSNCGARKE